MAEYDQYTWIFALSTIASFVCAFGIGANDVANSFASSVGAKAITIGQAVLIAGVMEFSGAVGLGAGVASTIKGGITSSTTFADTPDLFMYGMFCVMLAAAFWDNLSCQLELPVSTTHTTVGAIIGMALVIRGSDAVIWSKEKDEFPYIEGVTPVFVSWFASPLLSGIGVIILFGFIRTFILRSEHSFQRGFYLLPCFVGLTFFIITLFIIQTGNKNKSWDYVGDGKACWISAVIAVPAGVLTLFLVMPVLKRWVEEEEEDFKRDQVEAGKIAAEEGDKDGAEFKALSDVNRSRPIGWWDSMANKLTDFSNNTAVGRAIFNNPVSRLLSHGVNSDIHEEVKDNKQVAAVWENAEVFDHKTESLFRYLQVFSAMTMSFAHGSNDVANAVGPYANVYAIWSTREVPGKNNRIPDWIYVMGGAGLVLGLATFGQKILRVVGVKIAKLTNSRGFAAELSTATVVLVASRFGLPVSTTQIITGAVIAIGLFEGVKGINWLVVFRIFTGWVITLAVAGFVSAAFTAMGVYSPSKPGADNVLAVNEILYAEIVAMTNQLNAYAASVPDATLNTTLAALASQFEALNETNAAYINPVPFAELQQSTLNLFNSTLVM